MNLDLDAAGDPRRDVIQRRSDERRNEPEGAVQNGKQHDGADAEDRAHGRAAGGARDRAAGKGDQGHDGANQQADQRVQRPGDFGAGERPDPFDHHTWLLTESLGDADKIAATKDLACDCKGHEETSAKDIEHTLQAAIFFDLC